MDLFPRAPSGQLRLRGHLPPSPTLCMNRGLDARLPNRLGSRGGEPSLVIGLRGILHGHKKSGYGMTLSVSTLQVSCSAPN